ANWFMVFVGVVIGLIFFAVFWKWENKHDQPLVAPKYLKRRSTWGLLLTTVLTMTGVFAAVNGVAVSLAQNPTAGFNMSADAASLFLLAPYALIGLGVAGSAGRGAPAAGDGPLLRSDYRASGSLLRLVAFAGANPTTSPIVAVSLSGIPYARMGNIVLNTLGVVTSPKDNECSLP